MCHYVCIDNCSNCTINISINKEDQKNEKSQLKDKNIKMGLNSISKKLDEIEFSEKEENSESESDSEETSDEDYTNELNPNAPICTRSDYTLHPRLYELQHMKTSELKNVKNFYIENEGVGKVYYTKPLDLRNIDIDAIDIGLDEEGEAYVEVKHRFSLKNKSNDLIKKSVIITFENVKISDDNNNYVDNLKREINAKFITFDKEKKILSFELPHL